MKKVAGSRASAILYNWLVCNRIQGTAIIPANICETVPAAYYKAGLQVIFCDIEPHTYQPSKREIEKNIVRLGGHCVLHYNHTYGAILGGDEDFFAKIRLKYPGVIIVDDRCLCIPEQKSSSENVDLCLFSTGKAKIVDLNFGGFAFISDRWSYHTVLTSYNPIYLNAFEAHIKECHKYRKMVSKEILLADWIETVDDMPQNYYLQLQEMQIKSLEHKRIINNIYSILQGAMGIEYQNWRYNILVENQEECLKALFDQNLFASFHYMSLGNGYFDRKKTPNSDYLERHVINLFNDFHYSVEQAERTVEILRHVSIPVKEDC